MKRQTGTPLTRPPFQIDRLSLEALVELSRQRLPVILSSGPILGMTSPVTIAGTIAQVHAARNFQIVPRPRAVKIS